MQHLKNSVAGREKKRGRRKREGGRWREGEGEREIERGREGEGQGGREDVTEGKIRGIGKELKGIEWWIDLNQISFDIHVG